VSRFNIRLVVLGYSQCGAVSATVEELKRSNAEQSQNIKAIVDRISP